MRTYYFNNFKGIANMIIIINRKIPSGFSLATDFFIKAALAEKRDKIEIIKIDQLPNGARIVIECKIKNSNEKENDELVKFVESNLLKIDNISEIIIYPNKYKAALKQLTDTTFYINPSFATFITTFDKFRNNLPTQDVEDIKVEYQYNLAKNTYESTGKMNISTDSIDDVSPDLRNPYHCLAIKISSNPAFKEQLRSGKIEEIELTPISSQDSDRHRPPMMPNTSTSPSQATCNNSDSDDEAAIPDIYVPLAPYSSTPLSSPSPETKMRISFFNSEEMQKALAEIEMVKQEQKNKKLSP